VSEDVFFRIRRTRLVFFSQKQTAEGWQDLMETKTEVQCKRRDPFKHKKKKKSIHVI